MNQPIDKLRLGTRLSPLALTQVEEIKSLLKAQGLNIEFELIKFETSGDKDKHTSLTTNANDDFFTDSIDSAILENKIDIAIHSAKDLPQKLREGLRIFALTKSLDDTDAFVGKVKFKDLKPGAKIGTSSLIRQEYIKKLNPSVQIVDIRGTVGERIKLVEQGVCDGIIVATVALKRLNLKHLIQDIMPWEATALQGQLAVVGRESDTDFEILFSKIDIRRTYGLVYLVGAGPGDPDLITVKGMKILQQADCIFYDYLADTKLLDYATKAEKIYVGKRKGEHSLPQIELSRQLKQKALEGKCIVRLKGGDPLIFGRGAEEIQYLKGFHIPVEIIPGVSSATAIPSSIGIPLTARNISSTVAFLSGHGAEEDAQHEIHIPEVDTVVFLMGLTRLKTIVDALKTKGWKAETPIAIISKGTRIDQKVIQGNLNNIEALVNQANLQAPALIVTGNIVNFLNPSALKTKAILYTGNYPEKYSVLGNVIHFPMIKITPAKLSADQTKNFIKEINSSSAIILTSRCSVKYTFEILKSQNFDLSVLKSKTLAAIGADTLSELQKFNVTAQVVAKEETSFGLFREIVSQMKVSGEKFLFPRSALPNPYLKNELEKMGAHVTEFVVYENTKPEKKSLPKETIDTIIFTSPSGVRNFLTDYEVIPANWKILSKGIVTQKALKELGYLSQILGV